MKLYAPKYYREFSCIASRCRHSCCIGWEIDVDAAARKRYAALTHPYGETVLRSICEEGTPHFRLEEGERCPHLDESGLCKIITHFGDEYLCDICREHPRFYHRTQSGREVGVGMACEAACRLILSSDEYACVTEIAEIEDATEPPCYDATVARREIYDILQTDGLQYAKKIKKISETFRVDPARRADDVWREMLANLEYLDGESPVRFAVYSSAIDTPSHLEKMAERFLAYFVYRHLSSAEDEDTLRIALGLCLLCERLFVSVARHEGLTDKESIECLARTISEEIEYSEDNLDDILFEIECRI